MSQSQPVENNKSFLQNLKPTPTPVSQSRDVGVVASSSSSSSSASSSSSSPASSLSSPSSPASPLVSGITTATTISRSIPIKIKLLGKIEKNIEIDMPTGMKLRELKNLIVVMFPNLIISCILFSGKLLQDDNATLASAGVYKECVIQVQAKELKEGDPKPSIYLLREDIERPSIRRHFTEDLLQFGDVVIIQVAQAYNLVAKGQQGSNPYCMLTFENQKQRGSVKENTVNPKWNETFGFCVDLMRGLPKTQVINFTIYHNQTDGGDDIPLGSIHLRLDDVPRNEVIKKFCKLEEVGSGEVLITMQRHVLTSPNLRDILMKIIQLKQPWTKQILNKYGVTLASFLGTSPWSLPDDNQKNPALQHLQTILSRNQLDFTNPRNVAKVAKILRSQRVVLTEDYPCPTVHLSAVSITEKQLFPLLQEIVPNGVKSLFYNEPVITIDKISTTDTTDKNTSNVSGYCVVQFKSTLLATRTLLALYLKGIQFDAAFGPPKEPDPKGMIGGDHTSLIEGLMQVSTPQWRQSKEEEKKKDHDYKYNESKNDGEDLFENNDDKEYPVHWVVVDGDTVVGYAKLYDINPSFTLSLQEIQVRKTGAWTMDLVESSSKKEYNLRSSNTRLVELWYKILTEAKEGKIKVNAKTLSAEQRNASADRWMNFQCWLSKKEMPVCGLYSPDGHKWFADRKMLNQYVRKCLNKNQLDQITTRFTVSDLKDILSQEIFQDYSDRTLKELVQKSFCKCPACSMPFELDITLLTGNITPEEQTTMSKLKDEDGKTISESAQKHYMEYRVRCRNIECGKDFCRNCWEEPYHIGFDCEQFRSEQDAPKCRFCGQELNQSNRVSNPPSKALADVCTKDICLEVMKLACTKTLPCGHPCIGVRNEETCCPCFVKNCPSAAKDVKNSDGNCLICSSPLPKAPTIVLSCKHPFHFECVRTKLDLRWDMPAISFEFATCPTCKEPINHESLNDKCEEIRLLENTVRQMALQRLRFEGRHKDHDVIDQNGKFYNDEIGYADHIYAFFQCFECKKPYFAGAKECKAQEEEENKIKKEDLICNKCQKIESVDECKDHGADYLAYKCRYCCTMSVFHCWGKVHFCQKCHEPGVWDKMCTYSVGTNKQALIEYNQCEGIKRALLELMKQSTWNDLTLEQQEKKAYELRADPELCPLRVRHPPNGFEFGLGCTLCDNKKTDEQNRKNYLRVEQEMRERLTKIMGDFMSKVQSGTKFIHRQPMDEGGILYFFGTHGLTKPYENPATQGMVVVNSAQMMPDSEPIDAFVGRKVVRCVTKPGASCWFSVDFVDKFIKPTHYTLRHYLSWDTECLRNWIIEGSLDGEQWLVLRQHNNDQGLNARGQAYTWALHDYGCAFRRFRIKQTGPNNNNHYFLACSGFEVYGTLYKNDAQDIQENFEKAYTEQQKMKKLSLVKFCQMMDNGQQGVYHFTYDQDFDDNGILWFLGTRGGQREWQNPALMDEVIVGASSLVKDSDALHYLVGRETVRLVTKPEDDSWMQVDFKDKLIQPAYYTLRHYSSWDTECLRNWLLQASNDGLHWITVRKHEDDQGLNEKGATHTWPVQGRGAYRIWRIKQTGLNSNKHKHLACSGIEFYGQLYLTKFDPLQAVPNKTEAENIWKNLRFVKKCEYKENNDKNGVVYWIGTRGGTSSWVNPGAKGWIRCDASSLMRDSEPTHALCGRISVRCVTQPLENSWFSVDFKNIYVSPTHYSLRHYISWDTEALRNWVLEASFDGHTWVILRAHKDDTSLNHKGAVATWDLRAKGARYRAFRIRQIGLNSNNHLYNSLSGFDIYGDVYQIAYPQPRQADSKTLVKLGENENQQALQFDCSLTGEVPWDNKEEPQQSSSSNSSQQTQSAATPGYDEDQDMAFLREIARQEKQRLIQHLTANNGYLFTYGKDFDENGILHFLATDWRTSLWRNPAETGVVAATSSRLAKDSVPITAVCGRSVQRCVCMAESDNWFMIDFRTIYVRLTHYSLRHYDSWDTECLRNWYLEGTNDLKKFRIIHTHKDDKGLNGKGSTHTWEVDSKQKRYRAFRIRQYDKNSNNHWYLACSGIEFYGEIFFRPK